MDTAGALIGLVAAFAILSLAPGAFDAVFVVSAIAAVISVATIVTLAENHSSHRRNEKRSRSLMAQWRSVIAVAPARRLTVAAFVLGAATVGDAFLYLVMQRSAQLSPRLFPLLFVGTAATYLLFAVPIGRLADRIGRAKVLLLGYVVLGVTYFVLASEPTSTRIVIVTLGLLGLHYACTDGVLPALVSSLVEPEVRGTGLAIVMVAVAIARGLAAIGFGWLWTTFGASVALWCFVVMAAGAVLVAAILLTGQEGRA